MTTRKKKINVPGMGAILHAQGVFFRVWAPNAKKVFVAGSFNNWSDSLHPLSKETNGYWGGNVPVAKAGDEYKYIIQNGKEKLYRNDPYAKEVTQSNGNSIVTDPAFDWQDKEFSMPSWNQLVIYEMHIGTFNRKQKDRPGSFADVMEKLPYLQELGINAIEIMPPAEFSGMISWGYNPAHPFAIDKDYGGMLGFKRFVDAAHRHGMAVIIDVVYNHFGPGDLDLWRFDGWSEGDGGGIYFYQDWRAKTPWGHSRPDYGRSEVRQYIRDNALMWLDEYHVDGLRIDAISFIRNVNGGSNPDEDLPDGWSLLQWINKEVRTRFPWKISIAEDMLQNEWITKREEEGGMAFNSQWDIAFVEPVRELLTNSQDEERSMEALKQAVLHNYNGDAFQRVIFTESHDEVANNKSRVPEEIAPGDSDNWYAKKRSILGAVLVFTSPGIPMIFQGQEMLEGGYFKDTEPLSWDLLTQFSGIQQLYGDLISLRQNRKGFTKGLTGQHTDILSLNDEKNVIAYHRYENKGSGDSVVVVINLSDKTYTDFVFPFPEKGLWKVRFNSDWKGYDPSFGNSVAADTTTFDYTIDKEKKPGVKLTLASYQAIILSKD